MKLLACWISLLAAIMRPEHLKPQMPLIQDHPLAKFAVSQLTTDLDPSISMKVNSTSVETSQGEYIELAWSGVASPLYDDYLVLFAVSPSSGPHLTTPTAAPIKFKLATLASKSHTTHGAGVTTFRLLNYRQPVRFALLRGGFQHPRIAAWSDEIKQIYPNDPHQIHLGFTNIVGQVVVQWTTKDPVNDAVLKWRAVDQEIYTMANVSQSPLTYTKQDMCGPPANDYGWNLHSPGWMHRAIIQNVQPGQRYAYTLNNGLTEYNFELAPTSTPGLDVEKPTRILAIADLGQAEMDGSMDASAMTASLATTQALAKEIQKHQYHALVHNGDISYARGYSSTWDAYWDQLSPIVTSMPYITTVGNHERDWPGTGDRFDRWLDSGGECGVPYQVHASGSIDTRQPWYSVNVGPIHFLQYSTEHAFEPGSDQYEFIQSDLISIDRSSTPWVIVGGHRPVYLDSIPWSIFYPDGDQIVAKQLRNALEDLFLKHKVDMTWHGHHHSYQRTCKIAKGKCVTENEDGIVHLVVGNAGANLTPNVHLWRPRIFKKVILQHGYLKVEANSTHLIVEMIGTMGSQAGRAFDEFYLVKKTHDDSVRVVEEDKQQRHRKYIDSAAF